MTTKPTVEAFTSVRLRSVKLSLADLLLFVNAVGPHDSAEWVCSDPELFGAIQTGRKHPQVLLHGKLQFRAKSLKELVGIAPTGRLDEFRVQLTRDNQTFTLEAGTKLSGRNNLLLSYAGPKDGASEDFSDAIFDLVGRKVLVSYLKQGVRIALLLAFLTWIVVAVGDTAVHWRQITEGVNDGEGPPWAYTWKAYSIVPAYVVWIIATSIVVSGGARLKPTVRFRAKLRMRVLVTVLRSAISRVTDELFHGNHDRNAVYVALTALLVAILAWLAPLK